MAIRKTTPQARQEAQLAQLTSGNPAPKVSAKKAAPVATQAASSTVAEQVAAIRAAFPNMTAQEVLALVTQANGQAAAPAVPAKKAEKPAYHATPANMDIRVEGHELVIRIDLDKTTGKDSQNGKSEIIAVQNTAIGPWKVAYKGRDLWLSCMAGFKK